MAKIPPIPQGEMSLADIARMIHGLHDCVEVTNAEVKRLRHDGKNQHMVMTGAIQNVQREVREVSDEIGDVSNRVSYIEGRQTGIAERLGVPMDPERPLPVAPVKPLMKPAQWFWGIAVAAAGGAGAYKIVVAVALAAHAAIMGLK